MIELRQRQCFLAKPLSVSFVDQCTQRKDLDGNVPLQSLIMSAVDHTHTARTNLLQYAVVAEDLADELEGSGHGWKC